MKENLITFETAKLAKEKGFNEICKFSIFNDYQTRDKREYRIKTNNELLGKIGLFCSQPTQSLLQKWLREVHNIHLVVWWRDQEDMFYCEIGSKIRENTIIQSDDGTRLYKTYEEALETGLQEALKLIK